MKQPYNRVIAVDGEASGSVQVQTRESRLAGAEVFYQVDGATVRGTPSDTFWTTHDELSRSGVLAHDTADCPERTAAGSIRVWTPSAGWTEVGQQPHTAAEPGLSR